MVEYSNEEILNELSTIFRGRIDSSRDAGLTDPIGTHEQIMELAKLVFLLNPGAIFYLAKLVRNSLYRLVRQEISLAEDMLIAIDDLAFASRNDGGTIGRVGPSDLSNAATAILALEAADTINNRPELDRFGRIIDSFTGRLRTNVVGSTNEFVMPRGEARDVIQRDFEQLRQLHPRVLEVAAALRDIIANYSVLNIPGRVSQTALVNIRTQLLELQRLLQTATAEENVANSRLYLLRSLTLKVIVDLLGQFSVPSLTEPVLSSAGVPGQEDPNDPYFLRATGEGTPGFALSAPGPWLLSSLSSFEMRYLVDGGAPEVIIDLSVIQGPGLHGRNDAPFTSDQLEPVWPGPGGPGAAPPPPIEEYLPKNNLHIMLDPTQYTFISQEWLPGTIEGSITPGSAFVQRVPLNDIWNRVRMQPPVKLGFKHLGAPMYFLFGSPESSTSPDFETGSGFAGWSVDGQNTLEDPAEWENLEDRRYEYLSRPRVVLELCELAVIPTLTWISGNRYQASSPVFAAHYVGFYVRSLVDRYEIVEYVSSTVVIIDTRLDAPGSAAGTNVPVYGTRGDYTEVTFGPDLLHQTHNVANQTTGVFPWTSRGPDNVPDTVTIKIGPAIKTARVPAASGGSIANVLTALRNTAVSAAVQQPYAHAAYHVSFTEQVGHANRITIQNRSRFMADQMAISPSFISARQVGQAFSTINPNPGTFDEFPGPYRGVIVGDSGHEVFGFDIGQKVDPSNDPYLSIEELQTLIEEALDPATTSVDTVDTDVYGGFLYTTPGTGSVEDATSNFTVLGVGLGFMLEIMEGPNKGFYTIVSASGTTINLQYSGRGFVGRSRVRYRIFTRRIRISSLRAGAGSFVFVTVQPPVLGFPAGQQFGVSPRVEAVNAAGAVLDMSNLSPGDRDGDIVISAVAADGLSAEVAGGVSAGLLGLRFSFSGKTETDLAFMLANIDTILRSRNLLGRAGYGASLDAIDAAISPLLTPGLNLQANQNTAKAAVAHLVSVLTANPRLATIYSAIIPEQTPTLEESIQSYDAPRVPALDSLLDSLNEYRFDRALALLLTGKLAEFFGTTAETASFSGALLAAAKAVVQDLPPPSPLQGRVEDSTNTATSIVEGVDSDEDFSDAQEDVDNT